MQEYAEVFSWTILAIGAAVFLGTGAALLRYRRTGLLPGQSPEDSPELVVPRVRRAVLRLAVGLLLLGWGAAVVLIVRL